MYNHAPDNYECPFCALLKGEDRLSKQSDVLYQDEDITAFISSHWWPNNPGHVLIIPNKHHENIYDLPDDLSDMIYRMAKRIALAMKEVYKSDGVSTRQHNEHDGGQDVWHYHLHVFPRYKNDELYTNQYKARLTTPEERAPYAAKLKEYLNTHA
jgi:histidine triad (HIT) family protein